MKKTAVVLLLFGLTGLSSGCASLKEKAFPMIGQRKSEAAERMMSMARLMERHGKYDESQKLYQDVLERDPKNHVACHRLGILSVRRGEHDEALEYFERASLKQKPSAELLSDIGYTYYLKHELVQAEEKLREALQVNPQFATARTNLGLVLAEQGDNDEALAEFRKSGSEADALTNLAFVQTKLGEFAEAEKNYHHALELNPNQKKAAEALVQFEEVRVKADLMIAKLERENAPHENADVEHDDSEITQAVAIDAQPEQRVNRPIRKSVQPVQASRRNAVSWEDEGLNQESEPPKPLVRQKRTSQSSPAPRATNVEADHDRDEVKLDTPRKLDLKPETPSVTPANFGLSEPEPSPIRQTSATSPAPARSKSSW